MNDMGEVVVGGSLRERDGRAVRKRRTMSGNRNKNNKKKENN